MQPNNIIATASNIRSGDNPPYGPADFLEAYPQFASVPESMLAMYAQLASSSLNYQRYFDAWEMVMGLFMAHFCTLYLQTAVDQAGSAAQIIKAGEAKGLMTSKSIDGVSVGYDFSTALSGLEEWGGWTTTAFGAQLATLGKLYGKGGMVVW